MRQSSGLPTTADRVLAAVINTESATFPLGDRNIIRCHQAKASIIKEK